jgi:hypothetical protein
MTNTNVSLSIQYNSKEQLHKEFNVWSRSLLNAGVIFFEITVNTNDTLSFDVTDNQSSYEYISFFLSVLSFIDFIDCSFESVEISKAGIPQIHCIVGFRIPVNLINFILEKIEEELTGRSIYDYKLRYLPKFINVKTSLYCLSKDFNKTRRLNVCFICVYSIINDNIHVRFEGIIETAIPYISEKTDVVYYAPVSRTSRNVVNLPLPPSLFHVFDGRHSDLSGLPISVQTDKDAEIVYYLMLYLRFRKYLIYKNSLYQKRPESLLSYIYIGTTEEIKKNFLDYMFDLKQNFFGFIDPLGLSIKFSYNSNKILEPLTVLQNFSKKELNLEITEFVDGLYFASSNSFIMDQSKINELKEKFFVTRYSFYSYYDFLKKYSYPRLWKPSLLKNRTEVDFLLFAIIFRNFLFSFEEDLIRKSIFKKAFFEKFITQVLATLKDNKNIKDLLSDSVLNNRIRECICENEFLSTNATNNEFVEELPEMFIFCNILYLSFLQEEFSIDDISFLL